MGAAELQQSGAEGQMQVKMRTLQVLRLLLSKCRVVCRAAPSGRTWRSGCWRRWAATLLRAMQTHQPRQRLCVAANMRANASLHMSQGAETSSVVVLAVAPAPGCPPHMQSSAWVMF